MNSRLLFFALVLVPFFSCAQTTMFAVGKITDVRTRKGIVANIYYSSIPTGSINGRFADSTFSFPIFGTARYQVTAEANGYNPRTVILDPRDINNEQRITREIVLVPRGETIALERLIFSQGSSSIDASSFDELDEVVALMQGNPEMIIQLEGHTDTQGNASKNLQLSKRRVDAVKSYLVGKGVGKKRIRTKAFGSTAPVEKGADGDASRNRRVEIRILQD